MTDHRKPNTRNPEPSEARHPSTGRIVQFTFPDDQPEKQHFDGEYGQSKTVPAIIVSTHGGGLVNLRVFSDGSANLPTFTSVAQQEGDGAPDPMRWQWPALAGP